MRARIMLAFSFLIPFTLVFVYVWNTATNYIYSDEMYLITEGLVESYINGTLTFSDLWRPLLSIRGLGYKLLLLVDIKWFSMNSKLFVLLLPFLILFSAILIYREFRKSLASERSPEFIAATFLVLSLIIFNVIQWQGLIFRFAFNVQSPIPFIIASFISLELFLTKGRKYWPLAFILTTLAVLVFGGTLIFAFAPALGLTFFCYVLTRRSSLAKEFWVRALIISVFLSVITFLYMFRIRHNDYLPYPEYLLTATLAGPLEAVQYLLAAFGASIVGVDAFFAYEFFSFHSIVFIGLIVVLLYALALILFFRSSMYERTYLPFLLIIQVFFFLGLMTIGRFGLGDMGFGMSSRYTCVSIYGLVAMVWIFIFILTRPLSPNSILKSIIYAGFVMIFTGLFLTSIVVWRNQPIRKANFEQLYDIAMRVDTATYDELLKFEAPPEQVRDSLRLLRKYKMNIYHSLPAGKK